MMSFQRGEEFFIRVCGIATSMLDFRLSRSEESKLVRVPVIGEPPVQLGARAKLSISGSVIASRLESWAAERFHRRSLVRRRRTPSKRGRLSSPGSTASLATGTSPTPATSTPLRPKAILATRICRRLSLGSRSPESLRGLGRPKSTRSSETPAVPGEKPPEAEEEEEEDSEALFWGRRVRRRRRTDDRAGR